MNLKNNHYWLKSGSLTVLQNATSVLLSFGTFYFLVRMLDKHSFGTWALFLATTTIFETIRSGLIQNALIKFLSHSERSEHNKIISASYTMSGVLTIACIIINLFLAGYLAKLWHSPELVSMFFIYNIVYVFSGIVYQLQWIEQANLQFKGIFFSSSTRQGLLFVYVLVSFIANFKIQLHYLVYVQVVSIIASTLVQYGFVRKMMPSSYSFSYEWAKKIFHYGKFSFGTSISAMLSSTIDQMMLGALLSTAASGAFNIAVRIMNLVDIPTNSIAVIVFPQSAKRMVSEGKQAVKYLYEKSVGAILAILIPGLLFLYFFPGFIVHIIAGGKYAETILILKITTLYCMLIPFGRQFGTILDSIGQPKTNFLIVVLSATLNLTLNYFLIKRYGVMGAAYATLISNIVSFIIMQGILYKELKVNVLNTFKYAYMFYPEFFGRYIKPKLMRAKAL
jgi:O-antigen/teichoic acid export membrane protein